MSVSAFPYGVMQPPVASGPTVSANTADNLNTRFGAFCYSGVQYNTSGVEWGYNNAGTANEGRGVWLDSGSSDEVWVERTIHSGSWNSIDSGAGRWQLNSTRSFRLVRTTNGQHECDCTFDFYDAASGGSLLDSVRITCRATREDF